MPPFFLAMNPSLVGHRFWCLALAPMLFGLSLPLLAQESVWLCGQTLTNQWPEAPHERASCQRVQLPVATTVHTPAVGAVAPSKGSTPQAVINDRTSSVPAGAAQVEAVEQRQRDAQARQILWTEMERVQAQWRQAQSVGDAAALARSEADLASLKRELARLP